MAALNKINPVRNSSGALNPSGIIQKDNPIAAERRGIISSGVKKYFSHDKILILIILGSFALSLFYSFHFRIAPKVDANAYDIIAQNIVAGHGYRENLATDVKHDYAIARVGPLYQYFLAGLYKIFGHDYEIVWVAQAILHSLSALLLYFICLLIFSNNESKRKIGLVAAVIFGFYPDLIEISAMLLSETLYLFLVCLFIYIFFAYFYKRTKWLLPALALVGGLAVLARPPVLFFIPLLLFYFYRKKLFWPGILFLLIILAVFTPWTIRNYLVYDSFMPFGAAGAFNFWIGNWHGANGEQEQKPEHYQFVATHPIKEINGESIRQFKEFLFKYPGEFIKLTALRVNKYFSVIRPMGFWFYQKGLGQFIFIVLSFLASVFLFVFSLAGALRLIKQKSEAARYLLAFCIVTPLIIIITVVETRYRFQIYPLLAILAGFFIAELVDIKKMLGEKIFWLAAIVIALNGLIDLMLSLDRFQNRFGQFF